MYNLQVHETSYQFVTSVMGQLLSNIHRCLVLRVTNVRICAAAQQQLHALDLVVDGAKVQRRVTTHHVRSDWGIRDCIQALIVLDKEVNYGQ